MVLSRDFRASLVADSREHRAHLAERARLSEVAAAAAEPAPERVSVRCVRRVHAHFFVGSAGKESQSQFYSKQEWTAHAPR